jgi:predicted membrane-bound dolichyl-phosphate-mannose-protein mannosyltransferase
MQNSRHSISLLVGLTVRSWLSVQRPLIKHLGCSAWLIETNRRRRRRNRNIIYIS